MGSEAEYRSTLSKSLTHGTATTHSSFVVEGLTVLGLIKTS